MTAPQQPLPDIPAGTHLVLAPSEWQLQPGVQPTSFLSIRVVFLEHNNRDVATVHGHREQCQGSGVRCKREWCVAVLVSLDLLYRLAAKL